VGSLSVWFENFIFDTKSAVVTVIGSGGKTSLIWHLASSLRVSRQALHGKESSPCRKILVSPTTKMFVPPRQAKLYDRYFGAPGELSFDPAPGVTLAGCFNKASGKLESLPPGDLERMVPGYDLVLLEGDGSRGLPLKAWSPDEPVVPSFTEFTIGVLPLWPLGKPVSEEIIHRLPLFLALTAAEARETLKPEHILALITGKVITDRAQSYDSSGAGASPLSGLFAKAHGKKLLFFNQIEDNKALEQARDLAGLLPPAFRAGISGIIAGSVKEDWVAEL